MWCVQRGMIASSQLECSWDSMLFPLLVFNGTYGSAS
jgi:hypothetical protein